MALPNTDWLRHSLTVSGPAEDVGALQAAAAGAGIIPWQFPDLDAIEEDHRLALLRPPDGSPGLPPADAKVLASQLREAMENHQLRVLAVAATSRVCPFDLHALLPLPADILRRGPADAVGLAWLRAHWGVVQPLRRVECLTGKTDGRLRRSARLDYTFWSADWTPWPAFRTLRQNWPRLIFGIQPQYEDSRG
ncbi:hypothetical protein [Acidisoma sp.]|uniref:hypothetical protein n=1 Tax=Acidisoma sp. TaxID=1872115 RepID=UPI003B0083CC